MSVCDVDVESTTDVCVWTLTLSLPLMSVCDVDVESTTDVCV